MQTRNSYSPRVRQILDTLRAEYGVNMPLSKSFLRQDVVLTNTNMQYDFIFTANQANNIPLPQQFLNVTDGFYAYALGFYISSQVANEEGRAVLQTYPNQTAFPAAAGFNPLDLETIYNGKYSLNVNQTLLINGDTMKPFRVVPNLLQSATNANSMSSVDDGIVELEPNYKLAGTQQITLSVKLAGFAGMEIAGVGGLSHVLSAVLYGFLLPQGSDIFNSDFQKEFGNRKIPKFNTVTGRYE